MQTVERRILALIKPLAILVLATGLLATQTMATNNPAQACDQAVMHIAEEANVPIDVLRAITRTELGPSENGDMTPWPWTVNMNGRGVWFDTEDQAHVYAFRHFKKGVRSFDVGCFQINYKWHGHAFDSIEEMFDPVSNARYAATFLGQLREKHGSWDNAVGAYHSQTHKFAQHYLRRFSNIRSALDPVTTAGASSSTIDMPSRFDQQSNARVGSLVPFSNSETGRFLQSGSGG